MNLKRTPLNETEWLGAGPGLFLLFLGGFPPAFRIGGPAKSAEAMVRLASEPGRVRVITSAFDKGGLQSMAVTPDCWTPYHGSFVWFANDRTLRGYLKALWQALRLRPSTVYLNSVFDIRHSLLPRLAARLGMLTGDVIVCPRGELDKSAMSKSRTRKRLFLCLVKLTRLHQHTMWHATNEAEAARITQFFPGARVIVKSPEVLRSAEPSVSDNFPASDTFVFVGRLVPHKGLHVLLEAIAQTTNDVELHVYGPGQDSAYVRKCQEEAKALPPGKRVVFRGEVPNADVPGILNGASALLLPTASENFGHVIAEALSEGCPTYVPDTTPWSSLLNNLGTLVASRRAEDWARVMDSHLNQTESQRHELREATRQAFETRPAQWAQRSFIDVYQHRQER